ncbi:unnamed protein product, partial [Scytosiphon promiscuus]
MGPLSLLGRQHQLPSMTGGGRERNGERGRCGAAAAPRCDVEASKAVHRGVASQRRRRQGATAASATAGPAKRSSEGVAAVSVEGRGAGRAAGQSCRRGGGGSGSSSTALLLPVAACSLAVLVLLSDPAASFQPVAVQAPPQRNRQQQRELRRQPGAAAPCRSNCDTSLLQGSFAGRFGRQARRESYVWGLGWSASIPGSPQSSPSSHTALAATPAAGSGEWGSG